VSSGVACTSQAPNEFFRSCLALDAASQQRNFGGWFQIYAPKKALVADLEEQPENITNYFSV